MTSAEAFKELPRDIAAVDVKGMTYVFFVNSNHQLCYLLSPGPETDDYDPRVVKLTDGDLKVKCGSRQIAAAAWQGGNGQENKGYIQEVSFSSSTGWEHGLLGYKEEGRPYVDKDASLTACVHTWPDKTDIKVFASGKGENGRPKITIHQYSYGHKKWLGKVISNKVSDW
ncbi:hypothetical protein FOC4_g10002701 [Fusarium odoratissimum]|uniref:Fucose-specific lectin n=1 Tax=Fusarium oxysporum f. sp. cubense (strain race 4) TaxID=2502994 RepID=N1S7U7_FUSC4|nr:hypothetical protein FOC4_g10002700 [Fusarium odoratissimum]EMT74220.1 hypothetical protein FOC4_g10002701 [Fusarium odoratissimum]